MGSGHSKKQKWRKAHENGCVSRCGKEAHNYRQNGYNYAVSNHDAHYNVDFQPATSPYRKRLDERYPNKYFRGQRGWDPRHAPATWFIGSAKPKNWMLGRHPFGNQAHHVLPVGELGANFTDNERLWLMEAKYNVNDGDNIIILPTSEPTGYVMGMYTHLGSHDPYSDDVGNVIQNVKKKFSQGRDEKNKDERKHFPVRKEDMPNVAQDLRNWSKNQTKELFQGGKNNPGDTISNATVVKSTRGQRAR